MYRYEIGIKIKTSRKALGLTQKQLQEKTHVHKTTISEMENGRFTGSFDLFEKVLDAVELEFIVTKKIQRIPSLNEIQELFGDVN